MKYSQQPQALPRQCLPARPQSFTTSSQISTHPSSQTFRSSSSQIAGPLSSQTARSSSRQIARSLSSQTAGPSPPQIAGHSSSQTTGPSSFQQMLPLRPPTIPAALPSRRDRPSASQYQGVVSNGYSTRLMSSNADLGQLGSHTSAVGFPGHIANSLDHTQGQRSRGNAGQRIWRRRGRSPRRRGTDKLQLAVSFRRLKSTIVFLC